MDVQMPPDGTDDGLRAPRPGAARRFPRPAVLVLSNFLEERYPLDLIGEDAKGVGYLLEVPDRGRRLVPGIGAAGGGGRPRAGPRGRAADGVTAPARLADRRPDGARARTVLALMAEASSNHGIAGDLGVTRGRGGEARRPGCSASSGSAMSRLQHRRVMAVLTMLRAS